MGKNKLARFEENLTFPNLFQVSYEELKNNKLELKGRWQRRIHRGVGTQIPRKELHRYLY